MSKKRRWILGTIVGLLAVILIPVGLLASAFIGNEPLQDGRVIGQARTAKLGFVAAFMIDLGGGEVALIDTGADDKGERLFEAIRGTGRTPESVRAIFLTHGHGDHLAGTKLFPNAEVFALETERSMIEGTSVGHSPLSHFRSPKPTGIRLTRALVDGERVTLKNQVFRVFAVPGHTEGSAAYLTGRVLYLGDAANNKRGEVRGPPWIFSDDRAQAVSSLHSLADRLRREEPNLIALAFAHSGPLVDVDVIGKLALAR